MSIGGFVRRNAYWAIDKIFNHSIVRRQYDDIREITENYETGKQRVEIYLSNILNHAVKTTDYYRGYKGKSLSEFPVVNKMIYKDYYDLFLSSIYKDKKLHTMSTSGSTGTPFTIVQDKRKRSRVIAELKLFGEFCGYRQHEKMVFLRVLSEETRKPRYIEFLQNIYRLDITNLNEANLERIITYIRNKKVEAILLYSSTLDELVRYLEKKRYSLRDYHIKSVIAGGEALNIETRKKARNIFGDNCFIVSRYSNQEMGILGQDSNEYSGFKLNHGSYYFECLRMDSDEPVEEGEVGRLVITDLFNYAFPMIRYDTGDLGIMANHDSEWSTLRDVYGRRRDVIFNTKGEPVSPATISVYMWKVRGVRQWQFIQENTREYCLKINGDPDDSLNSMLSKLKAIIGEDAIINIQYVKEIPVLHSNKRRNTICKLSG